jgi:oligoendopeptidase F
MTATKTKPKQSLLPTRDKVKVADTWDLNSLYDGDASWEKDFLAWEKQIKRYSTFQGKLGTSADVIADCLKFDIKFDRQAERLSTYAFLKTTEDTANSTYQRMMGRFQHASSEAGQAASFIRPEIMAIPAKKLDEFLKDKSLAPYRLLLERMIR